MQAAAPPGGVYGGGDAAEAPNEPGHLRPSNLTLETQRTYLASVDRLERFLVERGMPTDLAAIPREHLESFVEDQLARWKPTTAVNRFTGIQQFFKWAVDEGLIRESPVRPTTLGPPRRERYS